MSRLPEHYPDAPGFKVTGPSEAAAKQVAAPAAVLRAKVLQVFSAAYPGGMTADEVATELGQSVLSVRPRVTELRRGDEIRDAGTRRKNASGMTATVWRFNPTPSAESAT